jgi:hypothetical protein
MEMISVTVKLCIRLILQIIYMRDVLDVRIDWLYGTYMKDELVF